MAAGLAALAARGARAATPFSCAPGRVEIDVAGETLKPHVEVEASMADLAALTAGPRRFDESVPGHNAGGWRTVGLTVCRFVLDCRVRVARARIDGRDCLTPSAVRVRIVQREHKVYLAADGTRPGTCERNVAVDHEFRHVAINDRAVREAADAVRRALDDLRPRLSPVWDRGIDARQGAEIYTERVASHVENAAADAFARSAARHGALDTPEAYRAEWARCG